VPDDGIGAVVRRRDGDEERWRQSGCDGQPRLLFREKQRERAQERRRERKRGKERSRTGQR
jgi:hypothetical protein